MMYYSTLEHIFRNHFFDDEKNQTLSEGDIHKRTSLANTLRVLAEEGSDAFYKGRLGRQVINELQQMGSEIAMKDLLDYR